MADGFLSRTVGTTALRDATNPERTAVVDALGRLPYSLLSYTSQVSITRTNDTSLYNSNDVIGINAAGSPGSAVLTFADIGPTGGGPLVITGAQLEIDVGSIPSGLTTFRLALYRSSPASALIDNNPFDLPSGDRSAFLGLINLGAPADLGSTLYCEVNGINKQLVAASSSLFGYLLTDSSYTPTALAVYKPTLHSYAL